MERLSQTDPITQLSDRHEFIRHFEQEVTSSDRIGWNFVLAICGIDEFKNINDFHGQDCGDLVLVSLAKLLRGSIRKRDSLGRWGQGEFILLFPETDARGGRVIAEKIRQNVARTPITFEELRLLVTVTIGVTAFRKGAELDECLQLTEQAWQRGKSAGGNRVVLSDDQ